ncbi:CYTH and CHAD domain-containing protein [Kitasatospora sp. NPDC048545]|uniref:CYTH and CHAD domain-containing protein n=1 Tax=Kitasatospora sp. NPDC048545 TaxID=3157208 RepID=UPI0033D731CE
MGREQTETERKYAGPALPVGLENLPGVASTRRAEPHDLDAVYYDTSDLRLLRRGITVRRRTGGSDAGWHAKLPLGADSRQEVHLPLGAAGQCQVPADFTGRLAAYTRGAVLLPVAHLRTHRRRAQLLDAQGRILEEVTEDRVAAQAFERTADPAAPTRSGKSATWPPAEAAEGTRAQASGWTEFEVELEHGTQELLEQTDALLAAAGLTPSPWPSKLAHALGRTGTRQGGTAAAGDGGETRSAGNVVMHGVRAQCDRLLGLDGAVRCAQEDSIHQMRITARRLRSLLKAHRRLFDTCRSTPLADQLRWLARLLGEARDQEVLADQLVGDLAAVPAPMREGALRARITEHYTRGYRAAWQQVVAELDSARYFTLLDDLEDFTDHPPLRRRARRDAGDYLEGALRRQQRRTLGRLDKALDTGAGPARDEALHRARKAAKRARYTAECAQPASVHSTAKRLHKYAGRMKKLHKVLGDQHDSVVARQALVDLAEQADADPRHVFAYGVLHEAERRAADDALDRLPRLRRRAARRKLTRMP